MFLENNIHNYKNFEFILKIYFEETFCKNLENTIKMLYSKCLLKKYFHDLNFFYFILIVSFKKTLSKNSKN